MGAGWRLPVLNVAAIQKRSTKIQQLQTETQGRSVALPLADLLGRRRSEVIWYLRYMYYPVLVGQRPMFVKHMQEFAACIAILVGCISYFGILVDMIHFLLRNVGGILWVCLGDAPILGRSHPPLRGRPSQPPKRDPRQRVAGRRRRCPKMLGLGKPHGKNHGTTMLIGDFIGVEHG